MTRICVCTRIHQNNSKSNININNLRLFIQKSLQYADIIAIAVGSVELLNLISDEVGSTDKIHIFEVNPWGNFTPALNALIEFSLGGMVDVIMFQSMETIVNKNVVDRMISHMEPEDLVVGAALNGHDFKPGETLELTGVTTPWNTLAIWNLNKLSRVGFMDVAEGKIPGIPSGVEEVTSIATIQVLLGLENSRAKLVYFSDVNWKTDWVDESRIEWHKKKMESKYIRAEMQMVELGIKRGMVEHIVHVN